MSDASSTPADTIRRVVDETQRYYDGPADEIYRRLWQDNVHMGTWEHPDDTLQVAMDRTNHVMAKEAGIRPGVEVLDAGCGYGATAIFLAREYDCRVHGLNISERELELACERAAEAGVADRVRFDYGDFHALPVPDECVDVVWSQEAFLHGADKLQVLRECRRVLRPGGRLVISDLLVSQEVQGEEREKIYERVRSPQMWDFADYRRGLNAAGFRIEVEEDWSANVAPTYQAVLDQLRAQRDALAERVPVEQLESTISALQLWVDSARTGKIRQGLFVATLA